MYLFDEINSFYSSFEPKAYLIVSIVATFIFVFLGLMVGAYYWKFTHREFRASFVNRKVMLIWTACWACDLIILIFMWIYGTGAFNAHVSGVMILLLVLGIAIPVLCGVYLFFGYKNMAIGIDDKEIAFLGERIIIKKISKIELNNKTNQVIIRYIEGKKSMRRMRFGQASLAGTFIMNNASLLNQGVDDNNANIQQG